MEQALQERSSSEQRLEQSRISLEKQQERARQEVVDRAMQIAAIENRPNWPRQNDFERATEELRRVGADSIEA